jgi:predicted phosphate transport protein (TIGR00153 family)
MLARLMPKEGRFFDYFKTMADKILEGCAIFERLLQDFDHLENYSLDIRKIEHECDELTHQVIDLVNKVFITPVDREDIQVLVKTMDDVIDLVNVTAQCMQTYEILAVPPGLGSMAHVLRQSMQEVGAALKAMETLRQPQETLQHCIEVNRLENECDRIIREQVARLFREHKDDPLLVIKYKEIYETIEAAVDCCEDVANVIETITIKHT